MFMNKPPVNDHVNIFYFYEAHINDSFNFKVKTAGHPDDIGIKNLEIIVPFKYLSNFWGTFEMQLINWETKLV